MPGSILALYEYNYTGLLNAGFEGPSLADGQFMYDPPPVGWIFVGSSGVSANHSGFTKGNPNAPEEGKQVAFLQKTGSFYQVVAGLQAGTYSISFMAAQRSGYPNQDFDVLVDGTSVYHCTPGSTAYGQYTTATFTVTAGAHTIKFRATIPVAAIGRPSSTRWPSCTPPRQCRPTRGSSAGTRPNTFQYRPTGCPWTFVGE